MKDKIKKIVNKVKKVTKKCFDFINKKNRFNTMETICLMIIAVIFGMVIGGIVMYKKGTLNLGVKNELNQFVDTYTEILNEYYKDVSGEDLLEAGINGMVSFLGDPYSVYMDKEESQEFMEQVNGKYIGIGMEIIQKDKDNIEVYDAFEDGPAYKAGIRNGDKLIKVGNKSVAELSTSQVADLVKGKEGTTVEITVSRDNEEKTYKIKRQSVDIISVTEEVITYNDKKVGYILIDIFAANTKTQFEKALKSLEKENIDSLIIDVRDNSGGYLLTVTDILSLFLEKGDVIYQLKTKEKIEKINDKTEEKRDYKIAILTNGSSASASEVLTASLMENNNAISVGTTTFGKSKVQKTQELSNGTSIKYTFQEWLTPKGKSVGGVGIKPTYEVTYKIGESENEYDSQLTKALEVITE